MMKELLFNLLAFETINTNKEEMEQTVSYIEKLFSGYKLTIKTYRKNGKPSIVITTKKTKKPKFLLLGHFDVVPAPAEDFNPYESGSRIYARGASDMKGAVAALISSFKELLDEGEDISMGLMLTPDEEVGGFDGVSYLINEIGYSCDVLFSPDGIKDWQICEEEKSVWHLRITAKGVSAHGARPWLGENALLKLFHVYTIIQTEFANNWGEASKKNDWVPSINLGAVNGGNAANKVPDMAEMLIDIRYPEYVKKSEINKILKKAKGKYSVEIETLVEGPSFKANVNNSYVSSWQKIVKETTIYKPAFYKTHGSDDARFFSRMNIPTIVTRPKASEPHIKGEWVDFEDLVKFKDALKLWLISNK